MYQDNNISDDRYNIVETITSYLKSGYHDDNMEIDDCIHNIWERVYLRITHDSKDVTDAKKLIACLEKRLGRKVDVLVIQGSLTKYNISLQNCTWHIIDHPAGYHIFACRRSGSRYHNKVANDIVAELMVEFDRYVPLIIQKIDEMKSEKEKQKLLRSIVENSAKGLLNNLIASGEIKTEEKITISVARYEPLVRVSYAGGYFSCPLEELQEQLKMRFVTKSHKVTKTHK